MSKYSGHDAKRYRAERDAKSKRETLRRKQIRMTKYTVTDLTLVGQAA